MKRTTSNSFLSLLIFETIWVVLSITFFQLCNIERELQKTKNCLFFLKLNNTLEYFENNHILLWVLKDLLKTISDKVRVLVLIWFAAC